MLRYNARKMVYIDRTTIPQADRCPACGGNGAEAGEPESGAHCFDCGGSGWNKEREAGREQTRRELAELATW